MNKLHDFLVKLNSPDRTKGIWVNPENINEFRVGEDYFESGGYLDGWLYIGSLDSLSFGFQSETEALKAVLSNDTVTFRGKIVRVNRNAIIEAYLNGDLAEEFYGALEAAASDIMNEWADTEAAFKIDEVYELIEGNE